MPLFDVRDRTDDHPKTRGEGLFAFYDRMSRRPFAIFRDVVNEWIAEMPAETAAEIVARMRKGEDLGFATGLSEIILHAAFCRLGFTLDAHPEILGTLTSGCRSRGSNSWGQRRHFGERTRGPRRKAGSPFSSNPQQRRSSCRH